MFQILARMITDGTAGKWFHIWESADGADTAEYLKVCEENKAKQNHKEYKMIFVPTTND